MVSDNSFTANDSSQAKDHPTQNSKLSLVSLTNSSDNDKVHPTADTASEHLPSISWESAGSSNAATEAVLKTEQGIFKTEANIFTTELNLAGLGKPPGQTEAGPAAASPSNGTSDAGGTSSLMTNVDKDIKQVMGDFQQLLTEFNDFRPPSPTPIDKAPSPSPTPIDKAPSPSPTPIDKAPSPSPTPIDTTPPPTPVEKTPGGPASTSPSPIGASGGSGAQGKSTGSDTGSGSGSSSAPGSSGDTNNDAGFSEQNGKFLSNGRLLNGIAITGQDAERLGPEQLADQLTSRFPNLNVVRLETSPGGGAFTGNIAGGIEPSHYQSVASIDADIKALNAKGVGVIVEDLADDAKNQPNTATGAALTKEAAWYAQIAKDNSGNKMVAFETPNEPIGTSANIANEQTAVYNAIRQNDKDAYVGIELVGGGGVSGLLPQTYKNMDNLFVDAHDYAFSETNPLPALQSEIGSIKLTDTQGKIPIIIGETGNAGMGDSVDPGAAKLLDAEYTDGTGVIACHYDGLRTGQWYRAGDENDMTTANDAGLTGYGLQIQQLSDRGVT